MALLADYAITPDVFDVRSYSSNEICRMRLDEIRRVMMDEGVVRDLRSGEWRTLFENDRRPWHGLAKEIVTKLHVQGRLLEFPATLQTAPTNDHEWCAEALASHHKEAMTGGVIVTERVKKDHKRDPTVERIDLLSRAPWWRLRDSSVRPDRKLADYRRHLRPLLRRANSIHFIDPHLHPERHGYREFAKLVTDAGRRRFPPFIAIHRVCYVGSGPTQSFPDFEPIFRRHLLSRLRAAGLTAKVFIWDDFHDRYLLSNLMGISMQNGFDITGKPDDLTTWTRLGRRAHDDIQLEFEPGSQRHTLRKSFLLR